ncbi:bifunctional ADP-dependent NAD(P)H-hydrate dehydratase/NAD(P)H-hydrate epimerase [Corynebacterium liangguodongii]|uniref:ADP-dependent (S)-NAD(P)H-hydrate dehydratase n=1 Tax=Corynebacterium liangguodongii TaxID=2079535 RepID=A0A2S0WGM2_9CORY|nr:bifunctional ADP-dependent NAD(P)H-hydrate dehydratase/NAD(P)H-hydrate epimerase [Corynebacterium liangguodongii]AWB84913.1 bifunctional ADP-dependent NAD(P)H-hydrate dehydratase/NAD(P)H-hydrate epimerase [Corynebacterium liangguodongii]PWB99379.1 bifunctional ADP-dependent NAD(P)H-hydrate dehydratase/NAD(P)H-hydrate epimerase [Corynebacterium liangguodongii]
MNTLAYTADQIRAAERPLLETQSHPDELMQQAAHAVFDVAGHLAPEGRILLLVGKGGNGGDALYAGAELAMSGRDVDAWPVFDAAHPRALEAFANAGGRVVERPEGDYRLVVDGVLGIGGSGDLPPEFQAACRGCTVLAVDVPSGISADTGERGENHITANVTVTFGGWRLAHGLAPECGVQLLADIGVGGRSLAAELSRHDGTSISRATGPQHEWPAGISQLGAPRLGSSEPGFYDDKYTGGVVGIRAGSGAYPGAAILCVAGAVAATPAMVRYAGPQALEVVRAHPEVVATDSIDTAGRVQAWVFGPGAGTDEAARRELGWVLGQDVPVLIDADGLTLLEHHVDLQTSLVKRTHPTIVTPHDGEFQRLRDAFGLKESDRCSEALAMAAHLKCTVVRKGRATIVAEPSGATEIVDAGNSWAATPGSGDVLAGIMGARVARDGEAGVGASIRVHAMAAKLAADTPWGEAQTSASEIAKHVRAATAKLS